MKMRYKYGIDFGTTNSSIAIRFVGDNKQEHTMVQMLGRRLLEKSFLQWY